MNLPFSMRICTPPENTQKVTPYVGDELSYSKQCPKRDSLCRWWSLISKNAKKSFSVCDEVSIFSASKVSGTIVVTPFPVWCACSLNKKIPFSETSPKTTSWMPGSSKTWLAVAFLHGLWWCSLTWASSRNHYEVMSRKKMDPFFKSLIVMPNACLHLTRSACVIGIQNARASNLLESSGSHAWRSKLQQIFHHEWKKCPSMHALAITHVFILISSKHQNNCKKFGLVLGVFKNCFQNSEQK